MTKLSNLRPARGATHRRKRYGIGASSGHGGTSGRGSKGQKARNKVAAYFEGGQTPLIRRIPKRGFVNLFRVEKQVVNLRDLKRFASGTVVDFDALVQAGLVRARGGPVKLLAKGELDRALTVRVHAASESACERVKAAGGSVELPKE
jgi:large subunit ribosomal protein L15